MRTLTLLAVLLAAGLVLADERPEPEIHGVFDGEPMYSLLPPDAIPAIREPEYVTGADAAAQMSDHEPVMALSDDGDAVAWSTWQLDHHEIVNDVLSGTAVAATW